MTSTFVFAAALTLAVPETVVEALPSVIVDVAPAPGGAAWLLARDERYGDPELWMLSADGRAVRAALPAPDGRRLLAIATSADGGEVWVLSDRALLFPEAATGAATAGPVVWKSVPIWLAGGDLKRAAVVPLARGRAAWVAELGGADGGPRLVGEIVDASGSQATFSLPCALRGPAAADGAGALLLAGVGRIAPSPGGWLGSHAECGEPSGSGVAWQAAALAPPPARLVAAPGGEPWPWQGSTLKSGEADAFTMPPEGGGATPRLLGAAPGAEGRVWVGVHGYVRKNAVTMMSIGAGGVESSFSLPFPRWWKAFLRREPVTLRDGGGHLWALQTYPGKASILLRRDATWSKWRAFYGPNVRPRVKLLQPPSATPLPGEVEQAYQQGYSCLAPVRTCFGASP